MIPPSCSSQGAKSLYSEGKTLHCHVLLPEGSNQGWGFFPANPHQEPTELNCNTTPLQIAARRALLQAPPCTGIWGRSHLTGKTGSGFSRKNVSPRC